MKLLDTLLTDVLSDGYLRNLDDTYAKLFQTVQLERFEMLFLPTMTYIQGSSFHFPNCHFIYLEIVSHDLQPIHPYFASAH